MNNMKRFASLLLALVMVLAMAAPAMAASITIANTETSPTTGHTYKVYQIFTGVLNGETLSDVKYGANYTPGEVAIGDAVADTVLTGITDAAAFADELLDADVDDNDIEGEPVKTLDSGNNWTATDLADGYYLIVDTTESLPEGDALSAYIVQIVGNVEMAPKSDTITSDKVISGDNYTDDYQGDDSVVNGDYSNGAIGTTVNFTLTVDVPVNADDYTYYYCVLKDTLSEGLTFNASSVVVKVGDETLTKDTDYKLYDATNEDTTDDPADGLTFEVAMMNAKSLAGKTITVTYTAEINEKAVLGVEGNPNAFDVDYSNNPEYDYKDENNNGKPDDDEDAPIGTTPEKKTYTYSTAIKIQKVDEQGNALTGAGFTIDGTSVKYVLVSQEVFTEDANGTYYRLKDGTYTTAVPGTADAYVVKTDNRDGGYVQNEDGTTYHVASQAELADTTITLYTKVAANADLYESTSTKYTKEIVEHVVGESETVSDITVMVDSNGIATFEGLGEGEYTITETVVPDGYNSIDPIKVVIDWTAPTGEPEGTSTACTWNVIQPTDAEVKDGIIEVTIKNTAGKVLPETGGMGTTLFYAVGGLLVAGAVVVLMMKKRNAA